MHILEFNDAAVSLFHDGKLLARSPGCAVLQGEDFLLGQEALALSRLNPRATFLHYWEQLDQQSLNRPAGRARSHADIAYFHLQALWQKKKSSDNEALLIVPAQFGSERLALLLGIAQACGIRVTGLVETAALAAAAIAGGVDRSRYLDISQHRTYSSDISASTNIALADFRELKAPGLQWCQEQCIRHIAEQFLQETRFDPLHEATSEQRLFDRLPTLLPQLNEQERVALTLPAGQREHRIDWRREQAEAALHTLYSELENHAAEVGGRVFLSQRLAQLPGLLERLLKVADCQVVSEAALCATAQRLAPQLIADGDAPIWVKSLRSPDPAPKRAASDTASPPSHVLHKHTARAIDTANSLPQGVALELEGGIPVLVTTREDALHNGKRFTRVRLKTGDALSVGAEDYRFIHVDSGS